MTEETGIQSSLSEGIWPYAPSDDGINNKNADTTDPDMKTAATITS